MVKNRIEMHGRPTGALGTKSVERESFERDTIRTIKIVLIQHWGFVLGALRGRLWNIKKKQLAQWCSGRDALYLQEVARGSQAGLENPFSVYGS